MWIVEKMRGTVPTYPSRALFATFRFRLRSSGKIEGQSPNKSPLVDGEQFNFIKKEDFGESKCG